MARLNKETVINVLPWITATVAGAVLLVGLGMRVGLLFVNSNQDSEVAESVAVVGYLIYDISKWTPRKGVLLDSDEISAVVAASRVAAKTASESGYIVINGDAVQYAPASGYLTPGMFGTQDIKRMLEGRGQ